MSSMARATTSDCCFKKRERRTAFPKRANCAPHAAVSFQDAAECTGLDRHAQPVGQARINRARHVSEIIGLGASGAQERTRTFTAVKPLAPEASAPTNSATCGRAG